MNAIDTYNFIDLFVLGTLAIAAILGIWKGFIRSLAALASLVLGVVCALRYYRSVEPYLGKISSLDPHISMILSMVIIFIAVQGLFVVLRRLLDALLDLTRLGWLDRVFGAAMGAVGGFIVVVAVVEALLVGIPDWPVVKESKLARPVDDAARRAMQYAPRSWTDQMQAFLDQWKGMQGISAAQPPAGRPVPARGPAAVPPNAAR